MSDNLDNPNLNEGFNETLRQGHQGVLAEARRLVEEDLADGPEGGDIDDFPPLDLEGMINRQRSTNNVAGGRMRMKMKMKISTGSI